MLIRGSTRLRPFNLISCHRDITETQVIESYNETIAQFSYRMTLGTDRSCDKIISYYSQLVPTVSIQTIQSGKDIKIYVNPVFGKRPKLSQFIDASEKAVRLMRNIETKSQSTDEKGFKP